MEELSVGTACLYGRLEDDDDTSKADSATRKSPRRMQPYLMHLRLVAYIQHVTMLDDGLG